MKVPYNLIRYIAAQARARGAGCSAEYLRQITKGHRRPSVKLAIHLEAVTAIHRDNWHSGSQAAVNTHLVANFPPTGDWVMFDDKPK